MSTITTSSSRMAIPPKFGNGEEWLHGLGDVPLSRIIFDPWPGTATEKDLLKLVEGDKRLCELIDGTLVEKPMGYFESLIASWLIYFLNAFLEANPIGVVGGEAAMMRLISGRVRMPDVSFINNEKLVGHRLEDEPVPAIGPDLAVEVISDSNTAAEIRQKTREYFESGTRLVWIIYPRKKTIEVFEAPTEKPTHVLDQSGTLDGGIVLPGFTLELINLFSKLPK